MKLLKSILIPLILIVSFSLGGLASYTASKFGLIDSSIYDSQDVDRIGRLALFGQMNGYNTSTFRSQIRSFKERGITEVEIFVMSPGGVVVDAFGACDVIERAKAEGMHITTVARGMVASAAVPVFLAGDVRIAGPNTVFMLHKPSREYITDENQVEYMDLNERLYIGLVAKYSGLTYEEVDKLCEDFTWFTAKEAKRFGMVDEIR